MREMVTFLLNTLRYYTHMHTEQEWETGGEVRSTGWMVCHRGNGQSAAMCWDMWSVVAMVTMGKLKGAKQGKQHKEGGLISKLAKEEFLIKFTLFLLSLFFFHIFF